VPHRHREEDETIHVIAGTFEVEIAGEVRMLGPGETAHVPRGTPHATRNVGDAAGQRVLVFTPAGIEDFFRAVDGVTDPARLSDAAERHGWELVR
jgi:quercetin dioxygenase-like cupin family protein